MIKSLLLFFIFICVTQHTQNKISKTDNQLIRFYQKEKQINQKIDSLDKPFKKFMKDLSIRESSHRWKIINKYGYIGKYQFGKEALDAIGYNEVTVGKFVTSPKEIFPPSKQDSAFYKLCLHNWSIYNNKNLNFVGKKINGIEITKSGLLAAMHLSGVYGTIHYLRSGGEYIPKDGFGTTIEEYLKLFSDHSVKLVSNSNKNFFNKSKINLV